MMHDGPITFRNPAGVVGVAVNVHGGAPITVPQLVEYLRQHRPPGPFLGPLLVFFTEIPPVVVQAFADEQGVTPEDLRAYYEQYVLLHAHDHPALEEWLYGRS